MTAARAWLERVLLPLGLVLLAAPALLLALRIWNRRHGDEPDPVVILQSERSIMLERWWLLGFLVLSLSLALVGVARRVTQLERAVSVALGLGLVAVVSELAMLS